MRRRERTKARMESYLPLSRIARRDDDLGGACNDLLCAVSRLLIDRRPLSPEAGQRLFGTVRRIESARTLIT